MRNGKTQNSFILGRLQAISLVFVFLSLAVPTTRYVLVLFLGFWGGVGLLPLVVTRVRFDCRLFPPI